MSQEAADDRDDAPHSPEREHRRQLALRHVRQYPDLVLRRTAYPVETFDDELRALVERMWQIMSEALGVGLAAPQLGLLLQVFTYQLPDEAEPSAIINPSIEWSSDEREVDEEGCLSLGEVRVPVERPVAVRVTGQDVQGDKVTLELEGFGARVHQHEIDHLNGVLMIDRASDDPARRLAMSYLRPAP